MASKRRYFNEHIQQTALGMKDDYSDYADNAITFSRSEYCMAGMPEDVKYVDVPERHSGFNRTVPAAQEEIGSPIMLDKGLVWRLK